MGGPIQFYKLALGARFVFRGQKFTKDGMSATTNEETQINTVFHGRTEVEPIGDPPLLSEEEAAEWDPGDLAHWADHIVPSPIERGDIPKHLEELLKKPLEPEREDP